MLVLCTHCRYILGTDKRIILCHFNLLVIFFIYVQNISFFSFLSLQKFVFHLTSAVLGCRGLWVWKLKLYPKSSFFDICNWCGVFVYKSRRFDFKLGVDLEQTSPICRCYLTQWISLQSLLSSSTLIFFFFFQPMSTQISTVVDKL